MKKYTNKLLVVVGIVILICNVVLISCSLSRFSENDNSTYDSYYDEYEYYDDDDYILDDERY